MDLLHLNTIKQCTQMYEQINVTNRLKWKRTQLQRTIIKKQIILNHYLDRKVTFKVMNYNIALQPKKVTKVT